MPTTLTGLLLFVALLLPGFAYLLVWEREGSHRRPSPLRETMTIVFGSVLVELAVLVVFLLIHVLFPRLTPDVGRLIREGTAYVATHYASLTMWGLGMLACAVGLAVLLAWRASRDPHPSTQSAWLTYFDEERLQMVKDYELREEDLILKVCCNDG